MWGSRVAFLVNILNFVLFQSQPWSPHPLCVAPEPGFPHSSVNGRINNHSPARIAFPGWVSLALAAGAAAARLRAPTQGPITPPWSCMITNLLPSLFFDLVAVLCSPKRTGAQRAGSGARGWCLFFRTRTEVSSSSRLLTASGPVTPPSRNFGMFYVRRLCLVTMATLCRDSRGGRRCLGKGRSRNTREVWAAHDERRSRSTQSSRAERSPPFSIIRKINHDP